MELYLLIIKKYVSLFIPFYDGTIIVQYRPNLSKQTYKLSLIIEKL